MTLQIFGSKVQWLSLTDIYFPLLPFNVIVYSEQAIQCSLSLFNIVAYESTLQENKNNNSKIKIYQSWIRCNKD